MSELSTLGPKSTEKITIYTIHLNASTAHYTIGENVLYGDEKKRKEQVDVLKKKWPPGSTWTLSNLTVKKTRQVPRLPTWLDRELGLAGIEGTTSQWPCG